jgi:hydroxymethylbilane synthase
MTKKEDRKNRHRGKDCPDNLRAWSVCPAGIRIGTRGSQLAVTQAMEVKNRLLGAFPGLTQSQIEIIKIETSGDRIQDVSLVEIGGKGLFTKEIEEGLLNNSIDIAVHSMKDMPDTLPEGLLINCILEREDPRDVYISAKFKNFYDLPLGATVGSSSSRRKAQLMLMRPDLNVAPIRGNISTRINKMENGEVDAILLAAAGLKRIDKKDKIDEYFDTERMVPAVAQGAIGVECAEKNSHIHKMLEFINHEESNIAVTAERALLKSVGGGCSMPLGGYAYLDGENIRITGLLCAPDGSKSIRAERFGNISEAEELGREAGEEIRKNGMEILINLGRA